MKIIVHVVFCYKKKQGIIMDIIIFFVNLSHCFI